MVAMFVVFFHKIEYIKPLSAFMVAEHVKRIRGRITAACARAGRTPDEVTLIAVSKTFPSQLIQEALSAGVLDIGENYIQELGRKRSDLTRDDIRWHFIGHLQSNKVKHIASWIHCIHAVDSFDLGAEISKHAEKAGR